MSSFELLAGRPFPLGRGLVLRNRLVGTAHAAGLVSGGLALPEDAAYWRRRAAGGAAMLVVGGTVTAPEVAGIERALASSRAIASGPSALAGCEHLLVVDDGFGNWPCASAVELGVRAAVPR